MVHIPKSFRCAFSCSNSRSTSRSGSFHRSAFIILLKVEGFRMKINCARCLKNRTEIFFFRVAFWSQQRHRMFCTLWRLISISPLSTQIQNLSLSFFFFFNFSLNHHFLMISSACVYFFRCCFSFLNETNMWAHCRNTDRILWMNSTHFYHRCRRKKEEVDETKQKQKLQHIHSGWVWTCELQKTISVKPHMLNTIRR